VRCDVRAEVIIEGQARRFKTFSRTTLAGVRQPRHLRCVAFRRSQIAFSWGPGTVVGSMSRGSQRRMRRLVFSTVPLCHGKRGSREAGLNAGMSLQVRPIDELRASVEGDRATGFEGQGTQDRHQLGHDRPGPAVGRGQQDGEAADALNQRGQVVRAEPLPEQDQIRLAPLQTLTAGKLG
jgi:hypothetical protein